MPLDRSFKKAQELFDHLTRDPLYGGSNVFTVHGQGAGAFMFRGQCNDVWPLLPSAFRPGNVLAPFAPQPAGCPTSVMDKSERERQDFLAMHVHQELRACALFLEHAEQLGVSTPLNYADSKIHHELIYEALNRRDVDWSAPFPDQRLMPWLALSQHHGVPTRLLDFSRSPLVAMFFAAIGASGFMSRPDSSVERISVTCLNTLHLDRMPDLAVVRAKGSLDGFVRAQQALFVLTTSANGDFLRRGRWPELDSPEKPDIARFVHKLTLPTEEAIPLLRILHRFGVTYHAIFPSLSTAARQFGYLRLLFGN